MIKKTHFAFLFFIIGFLILPFFWFTQSWYQLTNFVTDATNTLSAEQLNQLNELGSGYASATTNEIATLLIPNRNGKELYDISLEVFRNNGIGNKKDNNGVLLIVSTEEKKLRITVGYGLEWALPDVLMSKLIENDIRPLLNSGDIFWAVSKFYELIPKLLEDEKFAKQYSSDSEGQFLIGFVIGYMLLSFIGASIFSGSTPKHLLSSPKTYWLWWWAILWLFIALGIGIILGYVWFIIWWIVGAVFRNPSMGWWRWGYGGWAWGGGFGWGGWWWFGGFGWGSSGWWGAWD